MATQAASRGFASDPLWQQAQACLVRGHVDAARQVLASMRARQPVGGFHAHLLAAQVRGSLRGDTSGQWRRYQPQLQALCETLAIHGNVVDI